MWWGRPSYLWGGLLIVLGVLAVLANLGYLSNISWHVIWPLLLIGLGVWLIATRIVPTTPDDHGGAGFDRSDARDGLARAKLDIALGSARIDVRAAALGDQLYRAHIVHRGNPPEVELDRASGTVRISQSGNWMMGGWGRVKLEVQLNDALAWALDIHCGAVRGRIDLSTVGLAGFECHSGSTDLELSVARPAGEVPIRMEGGSVRLRLRRPAGAAVRVDASGGSIRLWADGVSQGGVGNVTWQSPGMDSSGDRYEARFAGGSLKVGLEQA